MRYWRTAAQDKYGGPGAEDLVPGAALDMFLIGRWGGANRMTLIIASLTVDRKPPLGGYASESAAPPKEHLESAHLQPPTPLTRPSLGPAGRAPAGTLRL